MALLAANNKANSASYLTTRLISAISFINLFSAGAISVRIYILGSSMSAILLFPCTSPCFSLLSVHVTIVLLYCAIHAHTCYHCPSLLCYCYACSIRTQLIPFPACARTRTYAHEPLMRTHVHTRARTVQSRRRVLAKLRLALVEAGRHYQILFSTIVCVFLSIVSILGTPAGYSSRILFDGISGYLAKLLTFGRSCHGRRGMEGSPNHVYI